MDLIDRMRPGSDITVTTDKSTLMPGDEVTATIRIETEKALDLEEGRAELAMENEFETMVEQETSSGSHVRWMKLTERTFAGTQRLIEPGPLAGGWSSEHVVTFRIPDDALPSGKGEITELRWRVYGVLEREQAVDGVGWATVTVLGIPGRYAARSAGEPEIEAEDCGLEFTLPNGGHLRAGGTLSGALVVLPREPLSVHAVRVELEREDHVTFGRGSRRWTTVASVVVADNVDVESRTEYPFELVAPDELCPCFETPQSTVRWWLRGVLARRMRTDYRIKKELNVYTGAGAVSPDEMAAAVAAAEAAEAARDEPLDVFQQPPGT